MVRLAALVHFKTNTSPLKKIAHVSLHITKKHRHFGLSSPVSFSFPARWQVVAPPRRNPKPPPFSKINTYLSILFHIEHKSRLIIFKMQAQKPRSTIKFEKRKQRVTSVIHVRDSDLLLENEPLLLLLSLLFRSSSLQLGSGLSFFLVSSFFPDPAALCSNSLNLCYRDV